jgi:hypothetical protein
MLFYGVATMAEASFFRLRTLPNPVGASSHEYSLANETGTGGDMSIGES